MDVSQNSTKQLLRWKKDIEEQFNPDEWEEVYPLYSQICFWIAYRARKSRRRKLIEGAAS